MPDESQRSRDSEPEKVFVMFDRNATPAEMLAQLKAAMAAKKAESKD